MRRATTFLRGLLALALFVVLVPTAFAGGRADRISGYSMKSLSDPHVGFGKVELHAQMKHSRDVVTFFTKGDGYWAAVLMECHPVMGWPWGPCRTAREQIRAHTWLLGVAERHLATVQAKEQAQARARARVVARAKAAAAAAAAQAQRDQWLVNAFLCIHSHEGAWNDPNAPYYGGLQFGYSEWQRFGGQYAPTADLATPEQQIQAGIAYYRVSGFYPWPNTARECGLI